MTFATNFYRQILFVLPLWRHLEPPLVQLYMEANSGQSILLLKTVVFKYSLSEKDDWYIIDAQDTKHSLEPDCAGRVQPIK